MTEPEWRIRTGRACDRELLAAFSCVDPVRAWEVEVEQCIQKQLLDA